MPLARAWAIALAVAGAAAGPCFGAEGGSVAVGGWSLALDGCDLRATGPAGRIRYALDLPPPCRFSGDRTAPVRVVKVGQSQVLLVESFRRSGERCDTLIRGLVVRPRTIAVSESVQNVQLCPGDGRDEVMYFTLANRARRIPAGP